MFIYIRILQTKTNFAGVSSLNLDIKILWNGLKLCCLMIVFRFIQANCKICLLCVFACKYIGYEYIVVKHCAPIIAS